MLALIDYGSGKIRSVTNALQHEGADVELVSDPARLADADGIVLPGVGAFGDCVRGLQTRGLWQPLAAWLAADRPFLGICVGYQMLFEESEESPGVRGFGFFGGKVKRFTTPGLKVPQIGWNQLDFSGCAARSGSGAGDPPAQVSAGDPPARRPGESPEQTTAGGSPAPLRHPLWRGLPPEPHVYFVHSFFPVPADPAVITARTTYGETFAASAARGRAAGVQFHPEKSQAIGLAILRNFIGSVPVNAEAD